MLRTGILSLAAGITILTATGALAGGSGCATCYRQVVHPPVYGTYSEQVMVRAPRTITQVVPAEYATVTDRVLVSPARKVWQVSVDAHGRKVGCWVTVPARYEVRHRQVLVREEQIVPIAIPAQYGTVSRPVLLTPARAGWEPIRHGGIYKH